jgi:cyclomaltodextrinase / maltogenic alpha-amylase / neopullulanase
MTDCSTTKARSPLAPLRSRAIRWAFAAVLAAGCVPEKTPVTLDTPGGDAWTFEKVIEGSAPAGACDTVTITSPMAAVSAVPLGGGFTARVPLVEGDNRVTAQCRKDGKTVGGVAEQHWRVLLPDRPRAALRTRATSEGMVLDAGASALAPARPSPIVSYEWQARAGNPAPLPGLPVRGKEIVLQPPQTDGEYYVNLTVTDAAGRSDRATAMFRVQGGKPVSVDLAREHPAWVDNSVVYGVSPFFFGPHGFADVTARLDALADVGVSVLWLSPVTESPDRDFGYAVTDYFHVRSRFGTEKELRQLIAAAHARGLKVVIDFVTNHVSDQHPYFTDAAERGRQSPYYDYFARDGNRDPAHYFDWSNLKNLNYDNPEVQRMMIAACAYWVRSFDVDGFRVDAAWGPRQRASEFWPHWREELKRIKPDLLLLAEASARDPYYLRHGFDAVYDWTGNLGEWAWQKAFQDPKHTASRLRGAIAAASAGINGSILRFLDNNDTGERFITRYGLARTRVASAMLLTLPGLPSLYTGDEVGAEFQPYHLGPPIDWDDAQGLRDWYRRLIAVRRSYPALHGRDIRLIDVAPKSQVLAYLRPAAEEDKSVLVLLNYGSEPVRVRLPAAGIAPFVPGARTTDLLTGESVTVGRKREIDLDGYGVRLLARD